MEAMDRLKEYRTHVVTFLETTVFSSFKDVTFRPNQITPLLALKAAVSLVLARFIVVTIYRLYFHPLRNFPGPLLGRITNLYSLYYDWWLGGKYSDHIRLVLHPKYGPIVRTRPNILRFSEPEAFNKIHSVGYTFIRDPEQYSAYNLIGTTFGTDAKLHRAIRAKTSPLFSKQRLLDMEPLVHNKAELLVDKIKMRVETRGREVAGKGKVFDLDVHTAMLALVFDIVQDFLADGVDTYKLLNNDSSPSFYAEISDLLIHAIRLAHWDRHFPIFSLWLQQNMPHMLQNIISPYRKVFVEFNRKVYASILHYKNLIDTGTVKREANSKKIIANLEYIPTFSDNLVLYSYEAQVITTAGSNTTAYVLAYMMYALAADPLLQQQLRDEIARLSKQTNGKLDYTTLQTSELLTAFIKESTRITNPVPIALPRYLPKSSGPVQISGAIIPPGTTVEMSPGQLFFDESIYGPNTDKFDIKRWLSSENDAATLAKRHKYWLPFGGGSYICLGIWMAYMELYIGAAKILDSGLWLELGEAMKREKEGLGWQGRDEFVMYKIGEKPVVQISLKA